LNATPGGGNYLGYAVFSGFFYPSLTNQTADTSYLFSYTYTDANGCTSSVSDSVYVSIPPVVSLLPFADVCRNIDSVVVQGGFPLGGEYLIDGTVVTSGYIYPSQLSSGLHTLSYRVIQNACTVSTSQTFQILTTPSISFVNNPSYCRGTLPLLLTEGIPNGGVYTLNGNNLNGVFTPNTPGVFAITYTYTSSNGCTADSLYNITVNPSPAITITSSQNACINTSSFNLSATPAGGEWTVNGISTANGNITPSALGIGNHLAVYTVSDPVTGCVADTTITFVVNNTSSINFDPLGNICLGTPAFNLNQATPVGGVYRIDGVVSTQFNSLLLGIGAHTVSYEFTNASGCVSSSSQLVNVYQLSVDAGNTISSFCNLTSQLNPTSNYLGSQPLQYQWLPVNGLSSGIVANPNVSINQTQTYNLTITNGLCSATDSVTVNIGATDFNLDFSQNIQVMNQPPFNLVFFNNTPNAQNYSFTWLFGDGNSFSGSGPVPHTYNNNGTFTVTMIATYQNGCSDTLVRPNWIVCSGQSLCNHTATINQQSPLSYCVGSTSFISCNTASDFSYQWNINGFPITGATDSVYYPVVSGNYSVTIYRGGCPQTSQLVFVNMLPLPQAPVITSSGTLNLCASGEVTLQASGGYTSYLWSNGATDQVIQVSSGGNYSVVVYDGNFCSATSGVFTLASSLLPPPNICAVTVDSTLNRNLVTWERPVNTALIDSFILYRETAVEDVFQPIHAQAFEDFSEFVDTIGMSNLWSPSVRSSRYRLAVIDTCGNLSLPGPPHKTLHLSINLGFNAVNLSWNKYEGYPVDRYIVLRGDSMNNLDSVATVLADPNSDEVLWSDFPAPQGNKYYQVMFEFPESWNCTPSSGRMMAARKRGASNISTNFIIPGPGQGIVELDQFQANVYPNPTQGEVYVEMDANKAESGVQIRIFDGLGKLTADYQLSGFKGKRTALLNLADYASGVYTIQISNSQTTINKRIVLQ
jgi:hypothetical protein